MICFPNAKINLGLHVVNKRDDGFHNIETVLYPLMFCDMLEMVRSEVTEQKSKNNEGKVEFDTDGLKVDGESKDNLIIKAFDLLDKDFNLASIKCFLYKKIPMGAGLGGGSADAAFAVKLINDVFDLKMDIAEMRNYAAQLGSDCAFFIENKPAYVFGKGNELENFPVDLSKYFVTLLNPGVHSSTKLAYKKVQTRGTFDESTSLKKLLQQPIAEWKHCIENDFERSVFEAIPALPKIKHQLYDCGALYASMSGSGSAMFGIFDHQPILNDELKKMVCFQGKM